MAKLLMQHREIPLPIDRDIKITGLKNPNYLVIIGYSTNLILDAVLRQNKQIDYVLIIEPNLGHFHQTIRRQLIPDHYKTPKVDLVVGVPPEELYPYLYQLMTQQDVNGSRAARCMRPEIILDPFAYPVGEDGKRPDVAEAVSQAVFETSKQVFLSMGCASDSFYRWEQFIRNKNNVQTAYNAKPFFGKFADVPAIVLGAGPSCEDFINAYKEYYLKDKAIIIAADACLSKLLVHGIKPHIVTRCERKLSQIFTGVTRDQTKGIMYAAYPWTPPEFFELFDEKIMLFRGNGLCNWSTYDPGEVNGGVSAANAALELAFEFGCKQIVISGIDLCHVDGKSHMSGTEVEFDITKSKDKWTDIPGNSGEPVKTIPVWQRCLKEYQGSIFKRRGQKVYNTSAKGAKIEGTTFATWEKVHCDVKWVESASKNLRKYLEKPPGNKAEAFEEHCKESSKKFKEASKDVDKLFLNLKDALMIARREETRMLQQVPHYNSSDDIIEYYEETKKQLVKVFTEPARQIDQFKMKWFSDKFFSVTVMDICQLDTFQTENKVAGLQNLIPIEYRRFNMYVNLYVNLISTYKYYLDALAKLLDTGKPDWDVNFCAPENTYDYR